MDYEDKDILSEDEVDSTDMDMGEETMEEMGDDDMDSDENAI